MNYVLKWSYYSLNVMTFNVKSSVKDLADTKAVYFADSELFTFLTAKQHEGAQWMFLEIAVRAKLRSCGWP